MKSKGKEGRKLAREGGIAGGRGVKGGAGRQKEVEIIFLKN